MASTPDDGTQLHVLIDKMKKSDEWKESCKKMCLNAGVEDVEDFRALTNDQVTAFFKPGQQNALNFATGRQAAAPAAPAPGPGLVDIQAAVQRGIADAAPAIVEAVQKARSQASSGRSSNQQSKFSEAVRKRDTTCVVPGVDVPQDLLCAAHIIEYSDRDKFSGTGIDMFCVQNGMLLTETLETGFDSHLWYVETEKSGQQNQITYTFRALDASFMCHNEKELNFGSDSSKHPFPWAFKIHEEFALRVHDQRMNYASRDGGSSGGGGGTTEPSVSTASSSTQGHRGGGGG